MISEIEKALLSHHDNISEETRDLFQAFDILVKFTEINREEVNYLSSCTLVE